MNARMQPMGKPLFTLSGVKRSFSLGQTKIQALAGIDLQINQGQFLAIWGPSGSGKSTLLNVLGLLDAPDEGKVIFDGQDIGGLSDDALSDCRNHKIGFVFQNFNLVPAFTVLENVMLPLQLQGVAKKVARDRARSWLAKVTGGLIRVGNQADDWMEGHHAGS